MKGGLREAGDFWLLVLAAQREGGRMLAGTLRPLGVTPAQAEVLAVLATGAPLTLTALGDRLVCETGNPSRLVDGMVRAGWVTRTRSAEDGRAVSLRLTAAGAELAARAATATESFLQRLTGLAQGTALDEANRALWALVARLPSGRALKRRRGMAR